MKLPNPRRTGNLTFEEVLNNRRTVRSFYSAISLTIANLSQLLWAAQGKTGGKKNRRTAPSAGALYPLDVYVVVGENCMCDLQSGIYCYEPRNHSLLVFKDGDFRQAIAKASSNQMWIAEAPVIIIIVSAHEVITQKYGKRGIRYALIEAGHVAQNVFLQGEALSIGVGIVGAFRESEVIKVLGVTSFYEPLLIMPVGYKHKP
jgi:SagB-type dehydrogenase family enzyme